MTHKKTKSKCAICGKEFILGNWRIKEPICSQKCREIKLNCSHIESKRWEPLLHGGNMAKKFEV